MLCGSATFDDPDGDLEGTSTCRWLVNGSQAAAGNVPQTMLLPLNENLFGTDGQSPTQNWGLTFVTGRFDQTVQISLTADSRLAYLSTGNIDPNDGSIEV